MSGVGAAILGVTSGITGYLAAGAQKDAAQKAADAQLQANQQALAAQKANTDQALKFQTDQLAAGNTQAANTLGSISGTLAPFIAAGNSGVGGLEAFQAGGLQAFNQQGALAGSQGDVAQNGAIANIQNSPIFQALAKQGNDAILQNASATGGLRGGNVQGALAQFQPALLNQLIQQQFQNLGGLSSLGQGSANSLAGLGGSAAGAQGQLGATILGQQLGLTGDVARNSANISTGNTAATTDLLGQQGAIGAGNALAQGQANAGLFGSIGKAVNLGALSGGGLLNGGQSTFKGGIGSALGPGEGASLINALRTGGYV